MYMTIATDDWGYESYWQITPFGNDCGEGVIAEGGNNVGVGCTGAGEQNAQSGNGYGDNTTVEEGPICLTIGQSYTLHYIDDYEDGGFDFTLNLFGFDMYTFNENGANNALVFVVEEPLQYDVQAAQVLSYNYLPLNNNVIRGGFFNYGSQTITDFEFSYSMNGGAAVNGTLSGLSIAPFTAFELLHPVLWDAPSAGDYSIAIEVVSINGSADMNAANNTASKDVVVGPGIPNMLDGYINATPVFEVIVDESDGMDHPKDLDFHPTLTNKELWVIMTSSENIGGKTMKISNAGESNQTNFIQQDGNAWHFMSLPTGIAFSGNENFATSPGVYDANHDGGEPFTGPTLWSSDPLIYAQPSGGNGSHLDMLHESPYSMGIAWEKDNKFWLTCGDHDEIMSYDFHEDHGPGNSDHSDGEIYKYPIVDYFEDPTHEIADHLVYDHASGWLYVCNSQLDRIIRINTNTGTPGEDVTPHEPVAVYKYMDDFVWEVFIDVGLNQPSGIDLIEDRLIVSNYANGDILIYDISSDVPALLHTIETGEPGIMGVKIGPDGMIWYVNSMTDEVVRIAMEGVSVEEKDNGASLSVYPNPAREQVLIGLNKIEMSAEMSIQLIDMTGRVVHLERVGGSKLISLNLNNLAEGAYSVVLSNDAGVVCNEVLIIR